MLPAAPQIDPIKLRQLKTVAKLVAEHAPSTDVYDAHHAYISDVYDALVRAGMFRRGLDTFKGLLVEANQARVLDLSRADFVEAMDLDKVRRSEIRYHSATFHFVRL